ncbi:putative protein [Pseudoclavibacter triregionum]|nr:putative protein [Pseudoclavibacter triregionum]
MTAPTPSRPARPQAVLHVEEAHALPSGLHRVVVGGPGFAQYADNGFADRYVKLLFADPEHGLEPPYDLERLRAERPEALPTRRTYTVRAADAERGRLTIDFVVHGDEGVAGPWARAAAAGDRLVLSGAGGAYSPDPEAPWHLLVGDLSALPAISQAVERLPREARGAVVLELPEDAEPELDAPAGLEVIRVAQRDHAAAMRAAEEEAAAADPLLAAVRELAWRDGAPHAFVHGERGSMKRLRRHLVAERGVPRERLSLSAYWALGRSEDAFQAEKREPIGRLDDEPAAG